MRLALLILTMMLLTGSAWAAEKLIPRYPGSKLTLEQMQAMPASGSVEVKFREHSRIKIENGKLGGMNAKEKAAFEAVLRQAGVTSSAAVHRQFTRPAAELDAERLKGQHASGKELADLTLYYIVDLPPEANAAETAHRLNALTTVEFAEPAAPSPSPLP